MKLLIPIESISSYGSRAILPCECEYCKTTYLAPKNLVLRALKGQKSNSFCSKACSNKARTKAFSFKCLKCEKDFIGNKNRKYCCKECANSHTGLKHGKNKRQTYQCLECKKEFSAKQKRKYCSLKCQARLRTKQIIGNWLSNKILGYVGKTISLRQCIRNFLIEKSNNQCSKCGWNQIHPITNKVPLEINHIDGNPKNCDISNLEVLCPNCHSLTPNFRNLNSNSPRNRAAKSD